jgi:hypothetical protein
MAEAPCRQLGEVLECQLRAEPQGGRNQREQPQNHQGHAWEVSGPEAQKVNRINSAGLLAKDSHNLDNAPEIF